MKKTLWAAVLLLLFGMSSAFAQSGPIVQEAFVPYNTTPRSPYRTPDGAPADNYWQNRADYTINARLDTKEQKLEGEVIISYTNNSPDDLSFVWVQLDQNLFAKNSRGALTTNYQGSRFGNLDFDGGYTIKDVTIKQDGKTYKVEPRVVDTNMRLDLQQALKGDGGRIDISINYEFKIPEYGSDRMGRIKTKNGWIYELAQWYPRMAVYDDIKGWNVLPYLGKGEFYLEYGDFDVTLTVPYDHIVLSSGELLNPEQVLTRKQRDRLAKARKSEKTVAIIKKDEVGDKDTRPVRKGNLAWHYQLKNARDIALGVSPAFIWDAARIDLPSGRKAVAMSGYPVESAGDTAWGRSTEYTKASIEFYSRNYYEFPWTKAVNIAGIVGGMEYPGLAFCSWKATKGRLWGVTTHEFGHSWFPMVVGSNERQNAWMDEGFNTFINAYATAAFNNGEYPARRTSGRNIVPFMISPKSEAVMTYPDQINPGNLGVVAYYKPALGLRLLREDILGHERFDKAFHTYINRWAYKHPTPKDFFNTMEDVSGEELDWFWKGWFVNTWQLDQAVDSVSYVNGDAKEGALISLSNNKKMVMPVIMQITLDNGKTDIVRLPVEIWEKGNNWTYKYNTDRKIQKVVLDPQEHFPDVNGANNTWTAEPEEQTGTGK